MNNDKAVQIGDHLGSGEIATAADKSIRKLIDTISKWFGLDARPRLVEKRIGTALQGITDFDNAMLNSSTITKASMDITGAQVEVHVEATSTPLPLTERVELRVASQEESRQLNAEAVVQKTVLALGSGMAEEPSDEPVNQDWVTRFFGIVQDVSDEAIQNLWALILKGEILRPGRFSLRTLEILKQISKDEAEVFSRVARHMLDSRGAPFLIRNELDIEAFGITNAEILLCFELGLLQPSSDHAIGTDHPTRGKKAEMTISYGAKAIHLEDRSEAGFIGLLTFFFSQPGKELASLIPQDSNDYFTEVIDYLKRYYEVQVIG